MEAPHSTETDGGQGLPMEVLASCLPLLRKFQELFKREQKEDWAVGVDCLNRAVFRLVHNLFASLVLLHFYSCRLDFSA